MAEDRFALIGKVHHTLADGVASANLLARLMDLAGSRRTSVTTPGELRPAVEPELLWEAQLDHFQKIAELPAADPRRRPRIARLRRHPRAPRRPSRHGQVVQRAADVPQPRGVAGPNIRDGDVSLAEVKETGKHLGVTFNDVVLAVAAGGLRELLLRYDGRADRPIMATVPVSHRQVHRPDHRKRDRRHHGVAAGARRRSAASECG